MTTLTAIQMPCRNQTSLEKHKTAARQHLLESNTYKAPNIICEREYFTDISKAFSDILSNLPL